MARDPVKSAAWKQRYFERLKVAKFGPGAAGKDMRGRHGNHASGHKNGRWNGGKMRTSLGYIAIAVPKEHHLRQAHGYAYEHQIVAERLLGRRLLPTEIVHHKNGNRADNRPENLAVETRADHAREHGAVPGARDEAGRFAPGRSRKRPKDLRVREFPAATTEEKT